MLYRWMWVLLLYFFAKYLWYILRTDESFCENKAAKYDKGSTINDRYLKQCKCKKLNKTFIKFKINTNIAVKNISIFASPCQIQIQIARVMRARSIAARTRLCEPLRRRDTCGVYSQQTSLKPSQYDLFITGSTR